MVRRGGKRSPAIFALARRSVSTRFIETKEGLFPARVLVSSVMSPSATRQRRGSSESQATAKDRSGSSWECSAQRSTRVTSLSRYKLNPQWGTPRVIYALTINFLIKRTCRDGNQTIHQRLQGNILTCLRSRGLVVDRAVCPRSRVLKQIDWIGDIKISQSIRSNCVCEIIATVPVRWIADCGCIEGTTARGKLQVMDALGVIFDNLKHGVLQIGVEL